MFITSGTQLPSQEEFVLDPVLYGNTIPIWWLVRTYRVTTWGNMGSRIISINCLKLCAEYQWGCDCPSRGTGDRGRHLVVLIQESCSSYTWFESVEVNHKMLPPSLGVLNQVSDIRQLLHNMIWPRPGVV